MHITLLERKPGVWRLRAEIKDEFGRRAHKYETVHGTRADAEARIGAMREKLLTNTKCETVGQYIDQWLKDRLAFGQISTSSFSSYSYLFAHATKLVGHKMLAEFEVKDVQNLYREFARQLGANRTRDLAVQLRKAMREALASGLITKDPTVAPGLPKGTRATKETTLTQDEIARLVEKSREWKDFGAVIRFALATGCRRGEICGLQWRDVDLAKGTVQIMRNVTQVRNKIAIAPTKTRSGTRLVTLPISALTELRNRKGDAAPTDWVFGDEFGNVRRPEWITKTADRKFPTVGLAAFTFHDLRHAHATFLLQQKLPLKAISQRLGHSDIRVTLGVYSHVMPGDDESLASAINSVL